MPRTKRACVAASRQQPSSVAAADVANPPPRNGPRRGLLSAAPRDAASSSRQPRARRQADGDDGGTWFPDEIILFIFASFLDLADLVRCAATCRRWRRLVSSEAAFICRTRTPRWPRIDRFLPPVVAGFFHQRDAEEPCFVSTPATCRRLPALRGLPQSPPVSALVEVEDGSSLDLDSCRIVASRNGLVVAELRRGKNNRALKLCVCNPMSGEAHLLPPLSGKDGVGHYACTVLTAADYQADDGTASDHAAIITPHAQPASSFRVVVVYSRRTFTATRSYSSGDGSWGAEATVGDAHVGKKRMGLMRNGVVARGRVAYWLAGETVFGMGLDTLVAAPPMKVLWSEEREVLDTDNSTLLGTAPNGQLFAVQIRRPFRVELGKRIETIELAVLTPNDVGYYGGGSYYGGGGPRIPPWEEKFRIRVDQFLPDGALTTKVKLQWFCEKSGLVFFNVSGWYVGDPGQGRSDVYALSFATRSIQKVASNGGGSVYGYEMDQVAYLASLSH